MKKAFFIEGPLLDRLGERETCYGAKKRSSYKNRCEAIRDYALEKAIEIEFFQSYSEGDLVSKIASVKNCDVILINPAAYTHTSVALRDVLIMKKIPFVEFHYSNIYSRETFRHISYLSDVAAAVVVGLGEKSAFVAVDAAVAILDR